MKRVWESLEGVWVSAVFPLLLSGLILLLSNVLGGGVFGWVVGVVGSVVPLLGMLVAWKILVRPRLSFLAKPTDRPVNAHMTYRDLEYAMGILTRHLRVARFVPDLIVGVDRGGAIIGGILSKTFRVPFAHVASSPTWILSSIEGSLDDGLKDPQCLALQWHGKLRNVLVVGDACRRGETLERAIQFLIGKSGFAADQIKTAVMLNELRSHKATRVDFSVYHTYRVREEDALRLPWDLQLPVLE